MRRPGWNPTRRNKYIGTAASGRGADNGMTLSKYYWEDLGAYTTVKRQVHGVDRTIIVEDTLAGFVHTCTAEDVLAMLAFMPPDDIRQLNLVVLKQPLRKEVQLRPTWGRMVEDSCCIDNYDGPAIFLCSTDLQPYFWDKHLRPPAQRELERLREDGMSIEMTKRGYEITPTLESARATILYRTLPHEVGHLVHYQRLGFEEFNRVPDVEAEDFAHRYGDAMRARLLSTGAIPFRPIED